MTSSHRLRTALPGALAAAATGAALALALTAAPASAAQAPTGRIDCSDLTPGAADTVTGRGCDVVTPADGSGPYEVWDTTTTAGYLCQVVVIQESDPLSISGSFCVLIA